MPLKKLNTTELRAISKEYIETLEYWLRLMIDRELSSKYGSNYIDAKNDNGDFLLKSAIRKEISQRVSNEPHRYPRPIDAALLNTEIEIICKPDLYSAYFSKYLKENFPLGREMVKELLSRLLLPRNCLYHANPISVRQAEQIICYSNDIIDSIKNWMIQNNLNMDYNVPKILKVTDSFGNVLHRNQFNPQDRGRSQIQLVKPEFYLRPGDTLSIEIEVDPTFDESEYKIQWASVNTIPEHLNEKKISIEIDNSQVSERFSIQMKITSNKEWHRLENGWDDFVIINYRVLPPL